MRSRGSPQILRQLVGRVFADVSSVLVDVSSAPADVSGVRANISRAGAGTRGADPKKMPNQQLSGSERSVDLGDQECIPGNLIND